MTDNVCRIMCSAGTTGQSKYTKKEAAYTVIDIHLIEIVHDVYITVLRNQLCWT